MDNHSLWPWRHYLDIAIINLDIENSPWPWRDSFCRWGSSFAPSDELVLVLADIVNLPSQQLIDAQILALWSKNTLHVHKYLFLLTLWTFLPNSSLMLRSWHSEANSTNVACSQVYTIISLLQFTDSIFIMTSLLQVTQVLYSHRWSVKLHDMKYRIRGFKNQNDLKD